MDDKSSTVLFLGAGASKFFGYPLTKEILSHILTRIENKKLFEGLQNRAESEFLSTEYINMFPIALETRSQDQLLELFVKRLKVLYPGLQLDSKELPSITNIMSLIDYLIDHDEALSPRFQPKFLHELRELLERAIMEVLEKPTDENNYLVLCHSLIVG